MTRHSMQMTRLVECGPVVKKGKHYVDANETPLHGIYHANTDDKLHAIVFIHGARVADYSYPCIDRTFSSPMVNDFNLHFVGRWHWPFDNGEGRALVERISGGLKPSGLIALPKLHGDVLLQEARDAGIAAVMQDDQARGVRYAGFAIPGTFRETFDLDTLAVDYTIYQQHTRFLPVYDEVDIAAALASIENTPILAHVERFLRVNPDSAADIITSGLAYGYPIETTVAFLAGTIA